MKSLKVVRLFTTLLAFSLITFFVTFATFSQVTLYGNIRLVFDFNIKYSNLELYSFTNGLISSEKTALGLFLMAIYGCVIVGPLILVFYFLSLIKKEKVRTVFSWLSFTFVIIAVVLSFIKVFLLSGAGKYNWLIFIGLASVSLIDIFLVVCDRVATFTVNANASVNISVPQMVTSSETSASRSMETLADSLEIKKHIENLKSGLNMPSYDEALEVIDQTGEWQGLNMKDVQEYDYQKEMARHIKSNESMGYKKNNTATPYGDN